MTTITKAKIMTKQRPENGAPGLRLLITTTSIVATLGGWALLTYNQSGASSAASQADPLVQMMDLAPIPTLIAPPGQAAQAFAPSQVDQAAPSFNQPAAPRLRSVPVPVTTTRSSR